MTIIPLLTAILSLLGAAFALYAFWQSKRLSQKGAPLQRAVVIAATGIALLVVSSLVNAYLVYQDSRDIPPEVRAVSGIPVSPQLRKIETAVEIKDMVSSGAYSRNYAAEPGFRIVESKFEDRGSSLVYGIAVSLSPDGRTATLRASSKQISPTRIFGFKIQMPTRGVISGRLLLTQQKEQ